MTEVTPDNPPNPCDLEAAVGATMVDDATLIGQAGIG